MGFYRVEHDFVDCFPEILTSGVTLSFLYLPFELLVVWTTLYFRKLPKQGIKSFRVETWDNHPKQETCIAKKDCIKFVFYVFALQFELQKVFSLQRSYQGNLSTDSPSQTSSIVFLPSRTQISIPSRADCQSWSILQFYHFPLGKWVAKVVQRAASRCYCRRLVVWQCCNSILLEISKCENKKSEGETYLK